MCKVNKGDISPLGQGLKLQLNTIRKSTRSQVISAIKYVKNITFNNNLGSIRSRQRQWYLSLEYVKLP